MAERKITWTAKVIRQSNAAIGYIRHDSPQNADKVKEKILERVNQLSSGKVVHHKDPNKRGNDGSFLHFEVVKHRIVYPMGEQGYVNCHMTPFLNVFLCPAPANFFCLFC